MKELADRFTFRIWLVGTKRYYNHKLPEDRETWFNLMPDGEVVWGEGDGVEDSDDMPEILIEQCTGLKDKKDKLIYEGDILTRSWDFTTLYGTHCKGTQIAKVVFDEGAALWETDAMDGNGDALWEYREESEIIGNIHQNPELLTAGDTESAEEERQKDE